MVGNGEGLAKKRKRADVADSTAFQEVRTADDQAAGPPQPNHAFPTSNGMQHSHATLSLSRPSSARLYPEWDLPEPVAVPHAFNTPELSYLQSSDTQQASDGQPGVSQGRRSDHDQQRQQQRLQSTADAEMLSPAQDTSDEAALGADQPQHHHRPPDALHQQSAGSSGDKHTYSMNAVTATQPALGNHQFVSQAAAAAPIPTPNPVWLQPDSTPPVPSTQQATDTQHVLTSMHASNSGQQQPQLQVQHPWQQQQAQQQQSEQQAQVLEQLQQPQQQQQQQGQHHEPDAALSAELRQQPGAGPSNAAAVSSAHLGAYSQRELFLQNLEDSGDMSFEYVLNDGQRHNSIWLIALKNIFSKQLPNMPKEYIARLVLDQRHRSVAIIRRKRNVVGGITYRPFHQQGFGEIAFCAVTANEQVKGFGTRLMNFTKEYAKTQDHLTHFLTYADNNAVGYFSKQGFTKEITLDKECWVGYIKDYDGGTLMECVIIQRLPHTRLPAMLQAQKQALDSCIRQYSKSHMVREGLTAFQDGARHVEIASIPGVKEAGWDPGDSSGTGVRLLMNNSILDATPNNLQHFMLLVVHQVQGQEDAWPFLEPVSPEDVPDYRDIIKDPVDLSLMESRLKKKDYYLTLDIFAADMRRIFHNCRLYNSSETVYFKLANKVESFFDHFMHTHLLFGQS